MRGYRFGNSLLLGGGIGYKGFITSGLYREGVTAAIPAYATLRYSPGDKRVVPYVGVNAGYDVHHPFSNRTDDYDSGIYTALEFGARLRTTDAQAGESWWLGSKVEFLGTDTAFISFKVGRSF